MAKSLFENNHLIRILVWDSLIRNGTVWSDDWIDEESNLGRSWFSKSLVKNWSKFLKLSNHLIVVLHRRGVLR